MRARQRRSPPSARVWVSWDVMVRSCCVYLTWAICLAQGTAGLEYHVLEEIPPDTMVGDLKEDFSIVVPPDVTLEFRFSPNTGVNSDLFTLDLNTGMFYTERVIDREKICPLQEECLIELLVIVQPVMYFRILHATVHITDRNDNPPTFSQEVYHREISESAMVGTAFSLPQAEDLDSPQYGIRDYILESNNPFNLSYSIRPDGNYDLSLVLIQPLDRETVDHYQMRVIARDYGDPAFTGSVTVMVSVLDANDNPPVFQQSSYEVAINENEPAGTHLVTVAATDIDLSLSGLVLYALTSSSQQAYSDLFRVNNATGEVTLVGSLDYEESSVYTVDIMATDRGGIPLVSYTRLTVNVLDVNDQPPSINIDTLSDSGVAYVQEHNANPEYFVSFITVSDPEGQAVNCSLESEFFYLVKIESTDDQYRVMTNYNFDREEQDMYEATIECQDAGDPPVFSSESFNIEVTDINDHWPILIQDFFQVSKPENTSVGSFLVQVQAVDNDTGRNAELNYSLLNVSYEALFNVDLTSGVVRTAGQLDYESRDHYSLFLVIMDDARYYPKSATALIEISIGNVNDIPPVFNQSRYGFSIRENREEMVTLGSVYATDVEEPPFNRVAYSLQGPYSEMFSINSRNGVIKILNTTDREYISEYNLTVAASNPGYELSTTASVVVTVLDVNDNIPIFLYPTPDNKSLTIPADTPVDYVIMTLHAVDLDEETGLRYTLLQGAGGMFGVRSATGELYVLDDPAQYASGSYHLTVRVQDSGLPPLQTTAPLIVHVNPGLVFNTWSGNPPWDASLSPPPTETTSAIGAFFTNEDNITFLIAGGIFILILIAILCLVACRIRGHNRATKQKDEQEQDNAVNEQQANGNCKPYQNGRAHRSGARAEDKGTFMLGDEAGETSTDSVIMWPPPGMDIAGKLIEQSRSGDEVQGAAAASLSDHDSIRHVTLEGRDSGVDLSWHQGAGSSDAGSKHGSLVEVRAPQRQDSAELYRHGHLVHPYADAMELGSLPGDSMMYKFLHSAECGSMADSGRGGSDEGEYHHRLSALEQAYMDPKMAVRYEAYPPMDAHAMALREEYPRHPLERVKRAHHRNSFLEDSISEHEEYAIRRPGDPGGEEGKPPIPRYRHSYYQPTDSMVQRLPRRLSDSERNRRPMWRHDHMPDDQPHSFPGHHSLDDLYEDADVVYSNMPKGPPPRYAPRQYVVTGHCRRMPPRCYHRPRREPRRHYSSDDHLARGRHLYGGSYSDFGPETDGKVYDSDMQLNQLRSSSAMSGQVHREEDSTSDCDSSEPSQKRYPMPTSSRRRPPPPRRMRRNTADTSFTTMPPDFFPDDTENTSDSSRQGPPSSLHGPGPYVFPPGTRPPQQNLTQSDTQLYHLPSREPRLFRKPSDHSTPRVNLDNDPVLSPDRPVMPTPETSDSALEPKSSQSSSGGSHTSSPPMSLLNNSPTPLEGSHGSPSRQHSPECNATKSDLPPGPYTVHGDTSPERSRRYGDESTDAFSEATTMSGSYFIDSIGPEDGVHGEDYLIV